MFPMYQRASVTRDVTTYTSNSTYLDRCRCNMDQRMPPQPPVGDCCMVEAQNIRAERNLLARRKADLARWQ